MTKLVALTEALYCNPEYQQLLDRVSKLEEKVFINE